MVHNVRDRISGLVDDLGVKCLTEYHLLDNSLGGSYEK